MENLARQLPVVHRNPPIGEPPATYGGVGWSAGYAEDYDREYCVDLVQLSAFLHATQPEVAEAVSIDTDGPTRRKFLARLQGEVEDTELVLWDTTTLTDGNYDLQLIIEREDEEPLVYNILGLRVRNYSLIETNTPAPTNTAAPDEAATSIPTITPAPTQVRPTPTPLPPVTATGGWSP